MTDPHPEFVHIVLLGSFFISSHYLDNCDFWITNFFCLKDLSVPLWLQVHDWNAGLHVTCFRHSDWQPPHLITKEKKKAQNPDITLTYFSKCCFWPWIDRLFWQCIICVVGGYWVTKFNSSTKYKYVQKRVNSWLEAYIGKYRETG